MESLRKRIKILIVEDDKNQSVLLKTLLERMNYEIETSLTGKRGVEIAKQWIPDIILLDLYLPDIDGIQVLEEIRIKEQLEHVPVVMMSVDFKEETVINALANGADEFIGKPIRMAELTLRINTILELKKKERELDKLNQELQSVNQKLNQEKNILARYFSYDFVEEVLNETISPELGGTNLKSSILFFDIQDSTGIAEKISPEQFSYFLSEVLKNIMDIVFKHKGSVNKILGDGILATFGCPIPHEMDVYNSCACALEIRHYLKRYNFHLPAYLSKPVKAGIGIATGRVFAGNIGSLRRMEYTVLGDPVNLASRLQNLTRKLDLNIVDILMDGPTADELDGRFKVKKVRYRHNIRGKQHQVRIHYLDEMKK
jgi:class 3 adenylate cyclase/ActR/RegA family two-component response regulator